MTPLPNLDCLIRQGDSLFEPFGSGVTLRAADPRRRRRSPRCASGSSPPPAPEAEPRPGAPGGGVPRAPRRPCEPRKRRAGAGRRVPPTRAGPWTSSAGGAGPIERRGAASPRPAPTLRALRAARRTLLREREVPWFHYQSHFADVFAGNGFDLIAGNPPWLRAEEIPADMRRRLEARYRWWRGSSAGFGHRPDLAVAFLERALELAAPGGVVALLVPAKLATAGYGDRGATRPRGEHHADSPGRSDRQPGCRLRRHGLSARARREEVRLRRPDSGCGSRSSPARRPRSHRQDSAGAPLDPVGRPGPRRRRPAGTGACPRSASASPATSGSRPAPTGSSSIRRKRSSPTCCVGRCGAATCGRSGAGHARGCSGPTARDGAPLAPTATLRRSASPPARSRAPRPHGLHLRAGLGAVPHAGRHRATPGRVDRPRATAHRLSPDRPARRGADPAQHLLRSPGRDRPRRPSASAAWLNSTWLRALAQAGAVPAAGGFHRFAAGVVAGLPLPGRRHRRRRAVGDRRPGAPRRTHPGGAR